jgi:type VI secretion system secreted protein VgrG
MFGMEPAAGAAANRLLEGAQDLLSLLASNGSLADLLTTQNDRLLQFDAGLPEGTLLAQRAQVSEAVNAPFAIELHALSPQADLDVGALVGQRVSLRLKLADDSRRLWHGHVLSAQALGADGGFAAYRFTIGPWLAFLGHRRDSFIWQDRTALQIVEDLFADYPQAAWRVDVSETLRTRSLCCQYRESDLEFVTRLLAEEGLSYHFEHLDGPEPSHRLVILDRYATRAMLGPVRFAGSRDTADASGADTITRWAASSAVVPNAVTLGSWDYKRLSGVTGQDASPSAPANVPALEQYDGAGAYRYESSDHAARAATLRLQAHEQHQRRFEAQGSCRALVPGSTFALTEHERFSGEYTVLAVRHEIVNNLDARAERRSREAEGGTYRQQATLQPADAPVLPAFRRRPTAPGLQTALVVGLQSESITTERDLRVKLQFPWQRGERPLPGGLPHDASSPDTQGNAPANEASGTWVRVAQRAAGANWGAVWVPRIGTEVLVDFVEGDIDRPLIVGQLHNGADRPPFAAGVDSGVNHPGLISGIHSPTLDGAGYNEWTIDDAPGQLRMRLHTSYANAELGLGHLIQQQAAQGERGATRGAGFELTTQGWGTLRAGQGMLITTSARNGTYGGAESTQMDAAEAVGTLKAAHDLAQRLSEAAKAMKAQGLSSHDQSVPDALQQLDPAQQGVYAGAVNGQEAKKADDSRTLTDPVERPNTPSLTLDSPSAIALVSDAGIASFSGQDHAATAQGDWHETAGHTASIVAGQTASWYAHSNGIQVKAANGPVSLRAHTDRLEILADSHVQVASVNGEITIQAKSRIELTGGDSQVLLDGENITFTTPGSFTVKAAAHAWEGAGKQSAQLTQLPDSRAKVYDEQFLAIDHVSGEPIAGLPYRIDEANGQTYFGKTDPQGRTARIATADATSLVVTWGALPHDDMEPDFEPRLEGC